VKINFAKFTVSGSKLNWI